MPANAFGMLYGTVALLAYAVLSGAKFNFDFSAGYVGSLLYLALFGSVVAFGSYFTLALPLTRRRTLLVIFEAFCKKTFFETFVLESFALLSPKFVVFREDFVGEKNHL